MPADITRFRSECGERFDGMTDDEVLAAIGGLAATTWRRLRDNEDRNGA